MAPQPVRIAQTTAEAKRDYKKNGPRLSERQQRQLERDAELDQRATRAREQEKRRKIAKQKREEQERREKESRLRNGVGLATQMVGYNHTQAAMKKGMEAFLGYKKQKDVEDKKKEDEIRQSLKLIAEDLEKEPWDDDEDDMADLPTALEQPAAGDEYIDSDVDDDTLLEAHELVMSDAPEEAMAVLPPPQLPQPRPPESAILRYPARKDDPSYLREHGPFDKTIEPILKKLPEPLIELLSQDMSFNTSGWSPSRTFLHKLNSRGMPPHRLRLKVGCVVILLKARNMANPPAGTVHMKLLQVSDQALDCLYLDGPDAGSKRRLVRGVFCVLHKNDERYPFQRIQFPVRVATNYRPPKPRTDASNAVATAVCQPAKSPEKSVVQTSTPRPTTQLAAPPAFKQPGLPASKSGLSHAAPKSAPAPQPAIMDGWDDFLDSASQIARDLNSESTVVKPTPKTIPKTIPQTIPKSIPKSISKPIPQSITKSIPKPISKPKPKRKPSPQRFKFPDPYDSSSDNDGDINYCEWAELSAMLPPGITKADVENIDPDFPPPTRSPRKLPWVSKAKGKEGAPAPPPPALADLIRKGGARPGSEEAKRSAIHDKRKEVVPASSHTSLKRKAGAQPVEAHQAKRLAIQDKAKVGQPRTPAVQISAKTTVPHKPVEEAVSFSEFGLSTQDVTALLDEDESMIFSSQTIV